MGKEAKPSPEILNLPLTQRAQMALEAAIAKVIERHIREGTPIHVWRDGRVVEVPASDLRDSAL
jgi:hypothetical protein